MDTTSWWCGLMWEQFTERARLEALRMASDKSAKHIATSPHQFRDPPRRRLNTDYGYALEAAVVEG